jgi:hypothetical protein
MGYGQVGQCWMCGCGYANCYENDLFLGRQNGRGRGRRGRAHGHDRVLPDISRDLSAELTKQLTMEEDGSD